MLPQFNLNNSIGWHVTIGRTKGSFLIPVWFLLIYIIYQRLARKKIKVGNYFFWSQVILSLIPPFIFNFPFVRYFLKTPVFNPIETLHRYYMIIWTIDVYIIVQFLFGILLLYKLVTKPPTGQTVLF